MKLNTFLRLKALCSILHRICWLKVHLVFHGSQQISKASDLKSNQWVLFWQIMSKMAYGIGIKHECEFISQITNTECPLQNERRRLEFCHRHS